MLAVAQPHIDENGELVEPFDPRVGDLAEETMH